MSLSPGDALVTGLIGVGATMLMDLWNLVLRRAFGVASLDYCLLGRWIAHMPAGTFRHASIAAAAPRPRECGLGWAAHYSIGVSLALAFAMLAPEGWLARPTPLPPLAFGVVTVGFPFLVLQPALGLGIAASKTGHPSRARLKSFGTHTVFGVGLYVAALLVRWVG